MKMRDTTSNLGAAIKAARKNKHLTQLELSEGGCKFFCVFELKRPFDLN